MTKSQKSLLAAQPRPDLLGALENLSKGIFLTDPTTWVADLKAV